MKKVTEFFAELLSGMGLSWLATYVLPEVIHGFFVVFFGVLGTIAIHYTNKWLKKNG